MRIRVGLKIEQLKTFWAYFREWLSSLLHPPPFLLLLADFALPRRALEPGPLWQEPGARMSLRTRRRYKSEGSGGVGVGKREGGEVGEVAGTVVGGFSRGAAICSSPGFCYFLAPAVEMFPGEMRQACVDSFGWN